MNKKSLQQAKAKKEELEELLVEAILSENYIDANKLLVKILEESKLMHERIAANAVILEADDDFGDNVDDDIDADADEADEVVDEPTDGDPELGEDMNDAAGETGKFGNEKMNEITRMMTERNYALNKSMILKLLDKVTTLNSMLNASDMDKNSMEYVQLEATILFYHKWLEKMQAQTMPGFDDTEQSKIKETIIKIDEELKKLEPSIPGSDAASDLEAADDDLEAADDDLETDDESLDEAEDESDDEAEDEVDDEADGEDDDDEVDDEDEEIDEDEDNSEN